MPEHGIFIRQQATSVSTPVVADSGVPFAVGLAPIQAAESPAVSGKPVLCTSWSEAVEKLGYSEDWEKYTLCELMYSHFQLFGCQPIVLYNVLDPADGEMHTDVAAADLAVTDHQVKLPIEAINDDSLVVKAAGGTGDALAKGTDYDTFYDGEALVIELLEDGTVYSAEQVNVAYTKVKPDGVTKADVSMGFEAVDLCMTTVGVTPDLLLAPGYSGDPVVAAVMTTKAGSVNSMMTAKAVVDIDCTSAGATTYTGAVEEKGANNFVDPDQILCWPMLGLGDYKFHMSTQLCGLMAQVDTNNAGIPYESPSNKNLQCDRMILADGTEVTLTLAQANVLGDNGICTALNFINGWVAWGNYTACYPGNTDVKDYFIPISRMFSWVGNTLIKTFWSKLDNPMNTVLRDSIVNSANIWLNGLTGMHYLLGGRVEMLSDENPLTDLMAGIIRLHVYLTPPSPAMEIDFILEYDASYVTLAFAA